MSAGLTTVLRCQLRMWRNAWRPSSHGRGQLIGTTVCAPLFGLSLYCAAAYFMRFSGLTEMLRLSVTYEIARDTLTEMIREALSLSTTTSFLVIALGALQQAFETYYLAPDLPLLLTSPLPRRAVFALKFALNMRWDAMMVLVTALPIWLAFATWLGAGWSFYVALCLGWVALLVLVSGVGISLAMLLVRLVSGPQLRQIMLSFLLTITFVVLVAIQGMVTGLWTRDNVAGLLERHLLAQQTWLPPVWLSRGLVALLMDDARAAWPWLALMAAAALLAAAVAAGVSRRVYSAGWASAQATATVATGRRRSPGHRLFATHAPAGMALVVKDLRLFTREPMQWYQAVVGIVAVAMVTINFAGQKRDASTALVMSLIMSYVGASTFALNLSLRAITKEGLNWWIIQTSPLVESDIYKFKLLAAIAPTGLFATLALAGMCAVLHLPFSLWALALPVLLALVLGMLTIDMAVGIWRADLQRAAETRNADVVAVMMSQILNYALLTPAIALLMRRALLGDRGAEASPISMLLILGGVLLPLCLVILILGQRFSVRALRSLRLSDSGPVQRSAHRAR